MSWLPAVGTLLGGAQSILGLFGADDAQKRAEQAAEQAILQFKTNASQAYNNESQAGQGNLYALSGQLAQQLQRQGGALGSALARAGVWNSTAAAGALANQGAANAGALATAQTNLGDSLNRLKDSTNMQAAEMQLGLNQNNLNYARNLYGGSVNGVTSFLSNLGQISNSFVGGIPANAGGAYSNSPTGIQGIIDYPMNIAPPNTNNLLIAPQGGMRYSTPGGY